MCRRVHKTQKICVKISKPVKRGNLYSFAFRSQNFAEVVENFAQMCVCVSATFRKSVSEAFMGFRSQGLPTKFGFWNLHVPTKVSMWSNLLQALPIP